MDSHQSKAIKRRNQGKDQHATPFAKPNALIRRTNRDNRYTLLHEAPEEENRATQKKDGLDDKAQLQDVHMDYPPSQPR